MDQRVKAVVAEAWPDDLSPRPGSQEGRRELTPERCAHAVTHTCILAHNNTK